MFKSFARIVSQLLIAAAITALSHGHALAKPAFSNLKTKVVTVTTTAQSITQLMGSGGGECVGAIANVSTTVVCAGGSDVNSTTTAGGKCWPICTTAASCPSSIFVADAPASQIFLVVASGTQTVFVAVGGTCS